MIDVRERLLARWPLVVILSGLALLLAACPRPYSGPSLYADPLYSRKKLENAESLIEELNVRYGEMRYAQAIQLVLRSGPSVVARAFLERGDEPEEYNFGAHGFLLFPSRLSTNLEQRAAAAAAFLCLFSDAESVFDQRWYEPENMAVFFAPVVDPRSARAAAKSQDPEQLLADYDYDRAKLIAQTHGLDPAGVYLIATGPSIEWEILDMSGQPYQNIEAAILAVDRLFWDEYRSDLSMMWQDPDRFDLFNHLDRHNAQWSMRAVFESLGRMVTATAAKASKPTQVQCA